MVSPSVIVVVPCYNEAVRLPREDYASFISQHEAYRFLFVDDGSTDATLQVLEALRQRCPGRMEVLKLEKNGGKAEAVRRGFLKGMESAPEYLAFWDADLATPLAVLPSLMEVFRVRPAMEMVFGSRVKLLGHDIRRRPVRHYLGRVFATFASWVLRLPVYDTQCGAKIFKSGDTLRRMFETPFLSRWIFDVELIARYLQLKRPADSREAENRIYEFALPAWNDVAGSKVKSGDFFKAAGELFRIWQVYRPGRAR